MCTCKQYLFETHKPTVANNLRIKINFIVSQSINISRISVDIHVIPTNARANRVFAWSFSPGHKPTVANNLRSRSGLH